MPEHGIPLVCPECGNNLCLLSPFVFAREHLHGADKKWYENKKKDLDDFLQLKMNEYKAKLEGV